MQKVMKAHCMGRGTMGDHMWGEERWSESFQDLASWCPPPQDELNTPQLIIQDEFNFCNDGQVSDRQVIENTLDTVSPHVDMQSDPWGTSDLLFSQPTFHTLDEENNNLDSSNFVIADKSCLNSGKLIVYSETSQQPSPVKFNGNPLLSQCSDKNLVAQEPSEYIQPHLLLNTEKKAILPDVFNSAKLNSSYEQPVIKIDPEDSTTSTIVKKEDDTSYLRCHNQQFKVPNMNENKKKERPQLKLNIAAANRKRPSTTFTTLDTPEVLKLLKPINESSQFNLLEYVCGDSDSASFPNGPSSCSLIDDPPVLVKAESSRPIPEVIQSDHDYADSHFMDIPEVKSEPMSPEHIVGERRLKKRKSTSSDDYIYDSDNLTDDSADWSPSISRKKAKPAKRKNTKSAAKISKRAPKRLTIDSDTESVKSNADRYRELRDRNNEASRRSRLNRKQREMEMNAQADVLAAHNLALKEKAQKLEHLVTLMRKVVMATFISVIKK